MENCGSNPLPLPYGVDISSELARNKRKAEELDESSPSKRRKIAETQEIEINQPISLKKKIADEKKMVSGILSTLRRVDCNVSEARKMAVEIREILNSHQ